MMKASIKKCMSKEMTFCPILDILRYDWSWKLKGVKKKEKNEKKEKENVNDRFFHSISTTILEVYSQAKLIYGF